jgi:CubicO group peptidase (beta-lactamase class C family)
MTESTGAAIEALINTAGQEGRFSGTCLVARGDEEICQLAVGLAHRGFGVPNTTETRFDIASITKTFTAVAVIQLVSQDAFTLETAVMPYLGIAGTRISDEVTVQHCLTHTSGIGDDADEEAGESYEALFRHKPNYSLRETIDFLPQFMDKEPNFAPGEGVRYNNVAWVLLGLMIERASGISYRDYVRRHVFAPAGMTTADFCAMDGLCANFAEHYKRIDHDSGEVEWRKNIYSYPPIGSPDGGATVTARDLRRFLRAIHGHRLLGGDETDALLQPRVEARLVPTGTLWNAFGFECLVVEDGRVRRITKDGSNAGVSCVMAWYPESETTIVLLANIECSVWSLLREIEPLVGV